MKKLMLLGGIRYLLPVIEEAHKLGIYVITADYLPNNIAHKFADEYVNVSIIDKAAVLQVAKEKDIDGIMSFGVDPGVIAASYVQEQMGLPAFGPYKSVEILQNKDKFRKFLTDNGFNVPWAFSFDSVEKALAAADKYSYPMIVKPTDSAGSKGCSRVDEFKNLPAALTNAMEHSISGHIIIEEFIEQLGCSSDTDSFSINGKLEFASFSAQRFDKKAENPYTPSAYSWPSTYTEAQENELRLELQRLLSLLKMNTSVYNIETRVGLNGKPYIMEVSPRGGGNRLSEMLRYATGVDLIKAAVCASVGLPIEGVRQVPYNGHWAEIILHSEKDGRFESLWIDESIRKNVVEEDIWVNPDDEVEGFKGANNAIGTLVLKFESQEQINEVLSNQSKYLKVNVKESKTNL